MQLGAKVHKAFLWHGRKKKCLEFESSGPHTSLLWSMLCQAGAKIFKCEWLSLKTGFKVTHTIHAASPGIIHETYENRNLWETLYGLSLQISKHVFLFYFLWVLFFNGLFTASNSKVYTFPHCFMNLYHYFFLQLCHQNRVRSLLCSSAEACATGLAQEESHQGEPHLETISNRPSPLREGGKYEIDGQNQFVCSNLNII